MNREHFALGNWSGGLGETAAGNRAEHSVDVADEGVFDRAFDGEAPPLFFGVDEFEEA